MAENAEIVREFIKAWSDLDAGKLADYFAEDGVYHNMPLQAVRGRERIKGFIEQFIASWTETDWEIIHLVESGSSVFAERLDRTRTRLGDVDLPCTGVFEMENGKIKVWRDYFDMATYMTAMKQGGSGD